MKNKIIPLLSKYRTILTLFIFTLSFFLPFIHLDGSNINGVLLWVKELEFLSQTFDSNVFLFVVFYGFVFLALIASIATAFTNYINKKKIELITSIVAFVTSVGFLFLIKKSVDVMAISSTPFLIKFVSFGYVISFLASFLALCFAMKECKVNRGYIALTTLSILWLFPIVTIILISFRGEQGYYSPYFIPKTFTFDNYIQLFTDTSVFYFGKWFMNTLFVAIFSCIISTFFVLSISFLLSRIRFKAKKRMMNIFLILGMFPGFMAMIAVYFIIKALGLSQSLFALIVVYSAGSGLGYYVVKGFFDTIPKDLDEAVMIDGGTKWQLFTRIIIPLSKPIIIYTILTSFISPWCDFIFASVIMGDNYDSYTVALGLFKMLENTYIDAWYTRFAAGSIIVAIPIAFLFISLKKFYVEGLSGSVKG